MAAEIGSASTGADTAAKTLESFISWLNSTPGAHGTTLGRGYQASTELFHSPAGDFAVKTARGPWPWRYLGEAAIRREYGVYRRISGVPGVPRCVGLVDGRRLVLEYVSGGTFRSKERQIADWDAFFAKLLETIRGIHAVGVAHGDLKRKDNILVGADERPIIVDFGVATIEKSSRAPWANLVFRWMRQYDYNAWVKLKNRARLDELTATDAALYRPTATERVARVIRVIWQKLTLRRLRRRIWPRR